MFCPKCGCEYREGFYECTDCGVPLVYEAPPPPGPIFEDRELVTILETADPALISVVKSLLEGSNIWFAAQGQGMAGLFPGAISYHPVTFQVDPEDEQAARKLLEEFEYDEWKDPIEP